MTKRAAKPGDLVRVRATHFSLDTGEIEDSYYLGIVLESNVVLYYRGLIRVLALHTQKDVHVRKEDVEVI